VDDSFAPGIGKRLDGWAKRDLNVGVIVSLAPSLKPFTDALGVDEGTVRQVLASWGPGCDDAWLEDGKAFAPDGGRGMHADSTRVRPRRWETRTSTRLQRGAVRGKFFNGWAQCSGCHVPPLFTEPGHNLHSPAEMGIDAFQADRSPTRMYRTAPLAGLWTHQKGGFYHDGRFATLAAVTEHYDRGFRLGLNPQEKHELAEYLKSL
jgi:hypothetical protein